MDRTTSKQHRQWWWPQVTNTSYEPLLAPRLTSMPSFIAPVVMLALLHHHSASC